MTCRETTDALYVKLLINNHPASFLKMPNQHYSFKFFHLVGSYLVVVNVLSKSMRKEIFSMNIQNNIVKVILCFLKKTFF